MCFLVGVKILSTLGGFFLVGVFLGDGGVREEEEEDDEEEEEAVADFFDFTGDLERSVVNVVDVFDFLVGAGDEERSLSVLFRVGERERPRSVVDALVIPLTQ